MNKPNSTKSQKPKRKTKRDDAASIVGEDLAELLAEYGRVKSNALVEMSNADSTSNRSHRSHRNSRSPVQAFLYPKGLSVKIAVAKSLHTQPTEARTEASKPKSIRRVVRDFVGLQEYDERRALASHFAGILQKSVFGNSFGNSEVTRVNPTSLKNVVRSTIGLEPVSRQPTKPMSVREAVKLSMQ